VRIVPLSVIAGLSALLSACAHSPETVAIQQQYVGADMTHYGRNPTSSVVGNAYLGITDRPQARCSVVKYDPYGRPYCDAVTYIR
jgi:hypothetical protein